MSLHLQPNPAMLSECIEHQGERNHQGYGRKWRNNKRYQAHRLAYCDANNCTLESIAGLLVRHKCDNPPCVNPDHLEIGTHKDNVQDCIARGRKAIVKGRALPQTLPDDTVAKVRELLATGMTQRAIARLTGVSQGTVSRILNGHTHT